MKEGSRIEFEKWHLFVNQIIETHNNSISKFHGYIPQMLDEADGSLDMLVRKKLISRPPDNELYVLGWWSIRCIP